MYAWIPLPVGERLTPKELSNLQKAWNLNLIPRFKSNGMFITIDGSAKEPYAIKDLMAENFKASLEAILKVTVTIVVHSTSVM